MSCTRAEQREAACPAHTEGEDGGRDDERTEAAGAASPTPVGAMSCTRAKQREAACAAQAEGENSGRDYERTEAAGGGESVTPVRATS
jgi:hypothetical protein